MKLRRLLQVTCAFALAVMPLAATGFAYEASPYVGVWRAIDQVDGSLMRAAIWGPVMGRFFVTWTESYFTLCDGRDGLAVGTGKLNPENPNILRAHMRLRCFRTGESVEWDQQWEYRPDYDVLASRGDFKVETIWSRFPRPLVPRMDLLVNYGHDWVESFYEAGHTVWVTVTGSDGDLDNAKATIEVQTEAKDYWGGEEGFRTLDGTWIPDTPDIQPGDWVFAQVDNGQTAKVTIGDIGGLIDLEADSIAGTIAAEWIPPYEGEVGVECHPWGAPASTEMEFDEILTDGVDEYSCSWAGLWNIRPWQPVGVGYSGPDGHWVANVFYNGARIIASAVGDWMWTTDFAPGASLTIAVYKAPEDTDPFWSETLQADEGGFVNAFIEGLEPGHFMTVSDGQTTKSLLLKDITMEVFDTVNDTMAGIAPPGSQVWVAAGPQDHQDGQLVTAMETGAWTADFTGIVNITTGMRPWSYAQIFDEDDDANEADPPPDGSSSIGLVFFNDITEAWNASANDGFMQAASDFGIEPNLYESAGDHAVALQQCADEANSICFVAVGWQMPDETRAAAEANPEVFYVSIDQAWYDYPDNLRGVLFKADEVGYLAGALAGLMTSSDMVGAIGGMEIPPVEDYVNGYRNGAQCRNSEVDVLIEYADDFVNPDLGRELAADMLGQGADVIFAPAGLTGTGSVLAATESGAWGIGVDTDFYTSVFDNGAVEGSELLLTSAVKRVDNAVYMAVQDWISGALAAGTVRYGLEEGGVGLADYQEASSEIPDDVKLAIQDIEAGIIDGSIDVSSDCAPPSMGLRVNYGRDDWVESFYEEGHRVDLTVTEADGNTIKATATAFTEPKEYWDRESGFTTIDSGWHGGTTPDLQPGDWVYATVDDGVTAQVRIGDIQGEVFVFDNYVTGTVYAPWIEGSVPVECLDWGSGQDPPFDNKDGGLIPTNGSATYSCGWDPDSEWDIQPWQDVGVGYFTPDGHWVANAFHVDVWDRLNPDENNPTPEHEVLECQVDAGWSCGYRKQAEPELKFEYPPDSTTGDFMGSDITADWVCPEWFPSEICNNTIAVVGGVMTFHRSDGTDLAVDQELIVADLGGEQILHVYWAGEEQRFYCPWYRGFDKALEANPFPTPFNGTDWPGMDCTFAP